MLISFIRKRAEKLLKKKNKIVQILISFDSMWCVFQTACAEFDKQKLPLSFSPRSSIHNKDNRKPENIPNNNPFHVHPLITAIKRRAISLFPLRSMSFYRWICLWLFRYNKMLMCHSHILRARAYWIYYKNILVLKHMDTHQTRIHCNWLHHS